MRLKKKINKIYKAMFENESKKSYLAGYTGYVPKFLPETFAGPAEPPKKHIPGRLAVRTKNRISGVCASDQGREHVRGNLWQDNV